jgi:DNA-binding NarL/FixJ family response regulator
MPRYRVLLVDDHVVVRYGMRLMLGSADDIEIVGEAGTASEALQHMAEQSVDVVLLDLGLPDRDGLDLLRLMRTRWPRSAVVVISGQPEAVYGVRALKLGAAGFLRKESDADTVLTAVRKAAQGGKFVSDALLQQLAQLMGGPGPDLTHSALTDRELEVLKLIAAGESLVNIGRRLNVSPSTVTTYRARILDKLQLKTNAELTRYAIDQSLLR